MRLRAGASQMQNNAPQDRPRQPLPHSRPVRHVRRHVLFQDGGPTSASPHFVVGSTRILVSPTCGQYTFGHSHVNVHVNDYAPRRVWALAFAIQKFDASLIQNLSTECSRKPSPVFYHFEKEIRCTKPDRLLLNLTLKKM